MALAFPAGAPVRVFSGGRGGPAGARGHPRRGDVMSQGPASRHPRRGSLSLRGSDAPRDLRSDVRERCQGGVSGSAEWKGMREEKEMAVAANAVGKEAVGKLPEEVKVEVVCLLAWDLDNWCVRACVRACVCVRDGRERA